MTTHMTTTHLSTTDLTSHVTTRIRPAGSGALLVCLDTPEHVTGLYHDLLADPPEGFIEAIPAAETVMVVFDPSRTSATAIGPRLRAAAERVSRTIREISAISSIPAIDEPSTHQDPASNVITIPVVYDGPDLDETARRTGLGVEEVVRLHVAGEYVVAFCGFAPGFAYLSGVDPMLTLPRRSLPRTRIPAGSVAVSDRYSCVYPHESPGGWHLLGRTSTVMWDLEREPPALLTPGTRVRFEQVTT